MMRQLLTGPGWLACLAAAVVVGTANSAIAFQQPNEQPENRSQETQEAQQPETQQPETQERETQERETRQTPANQQDSHIGEFDAFGRGYIRMSIQGDNSHVHNVSEQTQVTIDGQPARLNDLRTGDRIRVTMGENNLATRIEAMRQGGQEGAFPQEQQESRQRPEFQGEDRAGADTPQDGGSKAWLGVILNEGEQGQQGVRVSRIYPSGPAARAGLQSGDVLVQVAGQKVASPDEAARIIEQAKPNDPLELVVLRGDQRQTINATLADRSEFFFEDQRRAQGQAQGQAQAQGQQSSSEFDPDSQIPDHAMMLEQHRRFAEQHERIERKLDEVLQELADLKEQMGQGPAGARPRDARPRDARPRDARPRPPREGARPETRRPAPPTPEGERPEDATPERERPERD